MAIQALLQVLQSGERPLEPEECSAIWEWYQGLTPHRQTAEREALRLVLAELAEERRLTELVNTPDYWVPWPDTNPGQYY